MYALQSDAPHTTFMLRDMGQIFHHDLDSSLQRIIFG
jgi:hypothetical protein